MRPRKAGVFVQDARAPRMFEHWAPRLLNSAAAAAFLVMTGPLLLIVALAICFENPGPALDRRVALSREGRRFKALMFRTTEHDERSGRWSRNVTRVGQFLIYTRIAALPQLINVVLGDITLMDIEDRSSF